MKRAEFDALLAGLERARTEGKKEVESSSCFAGLPPLPLEEVFSSS